jgi:uncharacterized protein YdcH (DUF465 family)
MSKFLEISGIFFWGVLLILLIYLGIYGKRWFINLGFHVLSLSKFNKSLEKLLNELPNNVKKETISEIVGTLVWRATKIGLFALLIATIPFILLYQQNQLLKSQNGLFEEQNGMITTQSELFKNQNELIKNQLRPYIDISTPSDNNSITNFYVLNAPAFVDSMIIEFYVKEYGDKPFILIDRQIEKDFTMYPSSNQKIQRIQTNILTPDFLSELKAKNKRLMRITKIYYSNLNDEIGKNETVGKYKSERIDFLSKKTNRWYLKNENEE